jgi:hypothetical protein
MSDIQDLVRREEEKRNRCISSEARWRMIQAAIAWADAQRAIPRNSPVACKENERRILATISQKR